jgi:predicted phosphodiesterase
MRNTPMAGLIAALADCDLLVVGHTHKPWIHD